MRHTFCSAIVLALFTASLIGQPAAGAESAAKSDKKAPKAKPAAEKTEKESKDTESSTEKEEGESKAQKEQSAGPDTVEAKRGPIRIQITLDGSFLAKSASPIVLRPKQWTSWKVLEAVEHGARVQRGEVLVRFETEAIDKAIADQETSRELARLSLEQAEEDLRLLEASTPMDLALAARSKRMADEDLARFLEIDRAMNRKSTEFSLQSAKNSLEYQQEELRQLEKMYKADDLTEETEEIILRRQRDAVKRAEFSLEQAKRSYDESLEIRLPRQEESMKNETQREGLSMQRTEATLPRLVRRQRLELEKMRIGRERDEKKLDELLADRDSMNLKSPAEGVVYYGKWQMGKWSGTSSAADHLRRGGSVAANEVMMTVVRPRPLVLRVTVPEKELHWMRPDRDAEIKPTGYPDLKLRATVSNVTAVPIASGSFAAELSVRLGKQADGLMPGMAAKAKLTVYEKADALSVPASALSTADLNEDKIFVQVAEEKGEPKKHRVKVGRKSGDRVEILSGLVEGQKVLKEYPKDKK